MLVLAGDIGGTHARLAVVEVSAGGSRIIEQHVEPSRDFDSLEDVIERFVADRERSFEAACFGVPGPVRNGRVKTTNLPWIVDRDQLTTSLGVPVAVINDVEAAAWSVPILGEDDVSVLREGDKSAVGNGALIAPGTGLGQAGLYWDGSDHLPFATEGGHADFAPGDELERQLLSELSAGFGHVSWERVVSGPGLSSIHSFLQGRRGIRPPGCPAANAGDDNEPNAITRAAAEGTCPVCTETVQRFCRLLGAQTGNLALTVLALGGVWIGGGIAPDILPQLQQGMFEQGFLDKGRMREVLERIPVRVILDDRAALRGAARRAARDAVKT